MDLRNLEREPVNPGNEEHPENPAIPVNSDNTGIPENPGRSNIPGITASMTANGNEARMEEESQQVSRFVV